ncbi:hypothetical protein [Autumnicola musiva]|uniref:Uncharacterized protein n=1 Tax=Autumnicola musiva TaxID=3075589 RepID=A0ABU3D4N8_9FLAO|nr:hypothetical protein [Zunongwangia sp. F117]MDT0676498.1 hypothetical protein [Zunongwangia sp. F117]
MKSYTLYRNIRKNAVIFGLAVSSFAIQMGSVIASLLLIIFAFKLLLLLALVVWNFGLYVTLIRINSFSFTQVSARLPSLISNKQTGLSKYYEY